MRKMFVIFTACSLLIGCSTNMHYKDMRSSKPITDSSPVNYTFLFGNRLNDNECLAAYHKEGLLYLITKNASLFSVSVYNPDINIIATVPMYTSGYTTCKTVDFTHNKLMGVARLTFIVSPQLKQIFDHYKEHPITLKDAISSTSSSFTPDGRYNGERSTLNLPKKIFKGIRTLGDLESQLRALNEHRISRLIRARQTQIEDNDIRYKTRRDAIQEKQRRAQELWTNRMSQKLKVGDKVCSYTNLFGYLEKMSGNKVKVHVVGDASPYFGSPGYFFQGIVEKIQYKKIESIRWFNRSELAQCDFG